MKRYGYHRTSTREQHLDRGIKEITAYCEQNGLELEKIFTDQQTGKNFNRPRYQVLKEDVLRTGDELIITEVDRLGRNKQETLKELQYYRDNGIRVKILELPTTLMDLSKLDNAMARMLMETINNMMIELYAAMAQAEIEKKEKRQREGIDAKKNRGEWDDYSRPEIMSQEEFSKQYKKVLLGELRPFELMKQLGMSKSTYYRYVAKVVHKSNLNDMLPDEENSKAATCVEKAYEIWENTKEQKSAQLIFCDFSTPKGDGTFNVYEDIKNKLMEKGVPENEIAFIHDANTELRKAELFAKVRSGQVRFLLGSTAKMGAGTNVQDRLIALHHLDVPWRPSDVGRILRTFKIKKNVEVTDNGKIII